MTENGLHKLSFVKRSPFTRTPFALVRFAALVGVFCLSTGVAFAESNTDLINKINRLENEIETLNRVVYKGDVPPDGILHGAPDSPGSDSMAVVNDNDISGQAALEMRMMQMENDLRTLTGTIEQQGFAVQELQKKLDEALAGMDQRLATVESQMGGVPSAATPPTDPMTTQATDSIAAGVATTPEGQYEAAFSLLRNRQYVEAETALTGFIERNPEHKLVANARYWLGESYYARKEFGLAAKEFAAAYQKDPKGTKGSDSLLKLGMTLSALDKKKEACVALQQIEKEYKTGQSVDRSKQEIKRLGCAK